MQKKRYGGRDSGRDQPVHDERPAFVGLRQRSGQLLQQPEQETKGDHRNKDAHKKSARPEVHHAVEPAPSAQHCPRKPHWIRSQYVRSAMGHTPEASALR